ncbi:hypothetical protein V6N12_060883 [Hibiscus sabdariffa]|uniref:Uncharacterized protein n=1 Tax=Hibiscus sabdariffa TaxID=183260 RepID=A0ABR2AV17_9ROSI
MEAGPILLGLLKMGRFLSPTEPNHGRFGSGFLVGSGRVTQDSCNPRSLLSLSRISFPRRGPKLRESALIPFTFAAADRHSGERSGRSRQLLESPQPIFHLVGLVSSEGHRKYPNRG